MVVNIHEELEGLAVPFRYDDVWFNPLTRSYEFMHRGELRAEYSISPPDAPSDEEDWGIS